MTDTQHINTNMERMPAGTPASFPDVLPTAGLEQMTAPPWSLQRRRPTTTQGLVPTRGYWTGMYLDQPYWELRCGGDVVDTTCRRDLEALAVHVKHASGDVVIVGAGIGVAACAMAASEAVDAVTVLDVEQGLLDVETRDVRLAADDSRDLVDLVETDGGVLHVQADFLG